MPDLSIGEVAARTGLATSAIRYYEAEGLIAEPNRHSGRRVYGEEVLERLSLIELAKRSGFSIAEIRQLLNGFSQDTPPGERWRHMAESKLSELEVRISEAKRMRAILLAVTRCACPTFDDCVRELRRSPLGA